ncbi:MAG: zf-TFIIB domain-containing protein [Kofleriaceae bacterium]
MLQDRVGRMQVPQEAQEARSLAWRESPRAALPCASCAEPMQALLLFDVPVDRCTVHGVWFDRDELSMVLLRASRHDPATVAVIAAENRSVIDPSGAIELTADAVDVAVDAVVDTSDSGVFEVVIDGVGVVAEAVVSAIGSLFESLDL